ncbi:MAG TPA: hypothetical protein VF228_19530 [Iamia sp.]
MPAIGSTVGEAFAIAPDTYVVPGWWSFPGAELGRPLGTLVVRGQSTAVIDTAPAALEDDWLAAVLALVDPAEVRWIVATAPDPVRAGCVGALHALAPRATVVVPGGGCALVDLGRGQAVHLHEAAVPGQLVAEARDRRLLWTDLVGGAFARPARDVATLGDDELIAALARRARPLQPDELARTAALGLRVLGSPTGPVARGAGIARVLDLARRAEELRPASG